MPDHDAKKPLLLVEDARLDVDDVPVCDGLTFETKRDHVLVLGAPRIVFEAAAGLRAAVRGKVAILGAPAVEAAKDRIVAGASLDPPLPPKWTALEYVTWSARLAGLDKTTAASAAKDALAKLKLTPMSTGPMARLVPHARRATVVAAALATGAKALVLEDPVGALPEETARTWAQILVEALGDMPWVVFAPRVPLTSPLAHAAGEAVVVSGASVSAQGTPAELASGVRRFVAHLDGPAEALAALLSDRGVTATAQGARLLVDLGETITTSELLALSRDAGVTVVELHPVARALA